jgi:sulfur carrier protein ThiS
MTATIQTSSGLKSYLDGKDEFKVEAGRTVLDTLISLNIKPELIALVIVSGEQRSKNYIIQENDIVKVMAIIGGG